MTNQQQETTGRQPSDAAVEAAAEALQQVPAREGLTPTPWADEPEEIREMFRREARAALEAAYRVDVPRPEERWPGYGVCTAEGRWGQCVFVAGHHEVENWTPHADRFGRTWNDQPAEDPS